MQTWATERLDALLAGAEAPPVIRTMQLGTLDEWGDGFARKTWVAPPDMLNADGSLFGGLLAALADQILAFAAMTVVPGDKIFRTANLTVSYFSRVGSQALDIEANVISQSRQLIHVRATFRDPAGVLVAEAAAVQILQNLA